MADKKKKEKILVIVESPSKAKTINKYLGKDYVVESSKGHLIDLPKSKLGVDIENNFQPKYQVIRGKAPLLNNLKKKAKSASKVFLAADPDREGEAISYHLANALEKFNPDIKRIVFNEITKSAIEEAVKKPQELDMNKVNAQQSRRILDRLVGYNLSPLLWAKIKRGLSAGRVQSVALKIICEREKEIEDFKPVEYWTFEGVFSKENSSKEFFARLSKIDGKKVEFIGKEESVEITKLLKTAVYSVSDVIEKERKKNPLPPYITSKLQQDGLNRLGFPARKTMRLAQRLYEGVEIPGEGFVGLITYMRTDSTRISPMALEQTRKFIAEEFGDKYLPDSPNIYRSKKSAQDAHEAIRPTSIYRTPESIKSALDRDLYRLYKLIYSRFLASQMTPALISQRTVLIDGINNGKTFTFPITVSKYIFDGFTKVYNFGSMEKANIPVLHKGDKIQLLDIKTEQHFTQPPPRFTDASLIKVLEESGIGRPATYAPTIATLENRYYITREGRQLIPTELGKITNKMLVENFPEIINEDFTAQMEEKLDEVAEAKLDWVQMLKDFYPKFKMSVDRAHEHIEEIPDYKQGTPTNEVCEKCGAPMVKKLGRFGYFLACSNFPECRNAKPIPVADCPAPGCDGKIVVKTSKRRRKFYVCTNYPDKCNFITWDKPIVNEKCPKCGYYLSFSKKGKKMYKKCTNPDCDFIVEVVEEESKNEVA